MQESGEGELFASPQGIFPEKKTGSAGMLKKRFVVQLTLTALSGR